jgi:hypothetical protein
MERPASSFRRTIASVPSPHPAAVARRGHEQAGARTSFLFGVRVEDPGTYLVVGAMIAVVGVGASVLPAMGAVGVRARGNAPARVGSANQDARLHR